MFCVYSTVEREIFVGMPERNICATHIVIAVESYVRNNIREYTEAYFAEASSGKIFFIYLRYIPFNRLWLGSLTNQAMPPSAAWSVLQSASCWYAYRLFVFCLKSLPFILCPLSYASVCSTSIETFACYVSCTLRLYGVWACMCLVWSSLPLSYSPPNLAVLYP